MKRLIAIYIALCLLVAGAYAYLPATGAGPGAGAAASTTTWNPSDKDGGITLSGGNLVATSSLVLPSCSTTGFCGVRAIASQSSGKFYYEVVPTNLGSPAHDDNIGIASSSQPLNNFCGTVDVCVEHGGNVAVAGASGGTVSAYVSGDVVSVAADLTAKLIWFRTNAGNWNNNAGADPAAGTNGIDISGLTGPFFPIVNGSNDAETVFTANFGATAYAQSVPSGYGNW